VRTRGGACTKDKWLNVDVLQEQWIGDLPVKLEYEAMIRDVLAGWPLSPRQAYGARTSHSVTSKYPRNAWCAFLNPLDMGCVADSSPAHSGKREQFDTCSSSDLNQYLW